MSEEAEGESLALGKSKEEKKEERISKLEKKVEELIKLTKSFKGHVHQIKMKWEAE